MMRTLLKKLVRLGQGEDGAALVVTLALFMFMYLSCAGVFAIGQTAKNRIHLQNACDAAAYSAAVVQADTLSRIATINRAMAWTYVSMTRRQMDYIVSQWLKHTLSHFNADKTTARAWYLSSVPAPPCPIHASWGMGYDEDHLKPFAIDARIDLNDGSHQVLPSDIEAARSRFNSRHLNRNQPSFYSNDADETGLGNQIDDDKKTIEEMNRCIEELAKGMPGRIKTATEDVLAANALPLRGEEIYWFINQNDNPHEGAENWNEGKGYLRYLRNSEEHERKFLAFADCSGSAAAVFQTGIDDWFERANRKMHTENAVGLQRAYLEYGYRPFGNLVSTWTWWSTRSIGCELVDGVWVHGHADPLDNGCPHAGVDDRCHLTKRKPGLSPRHLHEPKLHGNSVCIWDDRYEGGQARPLILRDTYFGEKGTITVGLACYNENPWYGIFQNSAGVGRGILSGIFAAFNPYKDVEWSWAFSSAKAGYKFKNEDLDRRDYMIDWKESNQSWNLCQSDWDAVFVPVRRAVSKAEDGEWTYREGPPLDAWIKNGDWKPLKNSGGAYVVSNMPRLPGMNGSGSGINWNRVAEMLYH